MQNKEVKLIICNDPEEMDLKRAHEKYKIEAYNTRLYRRAQKLWDKLTYCEPDLVARSLEENNDNTRRDHYWWRRLAGYIVQDPPEDIYT